MDTSLCWAIYSVVVSGFVAVFLYDLGKESEKRTNKDFEDVVIALNELSENIGKLINSEEGVGNELSEVVFAESGNESEI